MPVLAIILVIVTSACGTTQTKPLAVRPSELLRYSQEKEGLKVAIAPIHDAGRLKDTFAKNLVDEGLLPLLVDFENTKPSGSFLVKRDSIKMGAMQGQQSASQRVALDGKAERGDRSGDVAAGAAASVVGGALGGPLFGVTTVMLRNASREQIREHSLADRELTTQTLSPQHRAQGFVYYNFGKGSQLPSECFVVVEVLALQDNKTVTFEFKLNLEQQTP